MSVLQRITSHLHASKSPPYVVNLDPAVRDVPYPTNIGELAIVHRGFTSRDLSHMQNGPAKQTSLYVAWGTAWYQYYADVTAVSAYYWVGHTAELSTYVCYVVQSQIYVTL